MTRACIPSPIGLDGNKPLIDVGTAARHTNYPPGPVGLQYTLMERKPEQVLTGRLTALTGQNMRNANVVGESLNPSQVTVRQL